MESSLKEYVILQETINSIADQNFQNTMKFIEEKLRISRYSSKTEDRDLHYAIRGAILNQGKNIRDDVLTSLEDSVNIVNRD